MSKKYVWAVVGILVLVSVFFSLKYFSAKKNSENVAQEEQKQKKEEIKKQNQEEEISEEQKGSITEELESELKNWQEYKNDKYGYTVKYPNSFNIFSEEGNSDLIEKPLNEEQLEEKFLLGGSVFWSNYKDINQYDEGNHPDDFYLLGLIIYEKENLNLDEFAKKMDFTEDLESESVVFKAQNITGKEFISIGTTESNPRLVVIFQKEKRFFVFHLGFTDGKENVIKEMEKVVGTFTLLEQ